MFIHFQAALKRITQWISTVTSQSGKYNGMKQSKLIKLNAGKKDIIRIEKACCCEYTS